MLQKYSDSPYISEMFVKSGLFATNRESSQLQSGTLSNTIPLCLHLLFLITVTLTKIKKLNVKFWTFFHP